MAQTIKLRNAHMMITEVRVDQHKKVIFVRFADGAKGEIPLKDLKDHQKLDLSQVSLPDPYGVEIAVKGENEPSGFPWDFARMYCDPDYAAQVKRLNTQYDQALARNLKRLRQGRGWSQEELEKRAGVSRVTISRIETEEGQSSRVYTLDRLAKALGVQVADLFKG